MQARWIAGLAVTFGVIAAGVANAATVGGLTAKSLEAWDQSGGVGAPTVLTCDDFSQSAPTGSALSARPVRAAAKCGSGTWTVHRGTWTISSGLLRASTADATATIDSGQTDISAQTTINSANGGNRVAGVAIDHTGSTRIYLVGALSGPSTAQLLLVDGANVSVLASASATITSSTVVRITRSSGTVTVSVNGALAITYTLSSTEITTLSGGTLVGLYWGSGNPVRFTDILATTVYAP